MDKNTVAHNSDNSEIKYDQLAETARREAVRENRGYIVVDGDVRILMPMTVAMMRTNLSKIQQDVILAIIDHIKKQLHTVLVDRNIHGRELSLFPRDEIEGDERKVHLKMYFKDFGISTAHYPQLAAAMSMLAYVPVQFPFKSADGKKFHKHTNFCSVYIPDDLKYNKYCIVSMEEDVARHIMNFDLGHLYVGRDTSRKMNTKYSERLYWYVKGHLNYGGVTISTKELRLMLGLEKKYKNFTSLEQKVLQTSEKELWELFLVHECECYFRYEKIFNDGRKRGEPDAIKFNVYSDTNSQKLLDVRLEVADNGVLDEIRETLRKDLAMPEYLVGKYMKLVNEKNKDAFLTQLITLKVQLDQKAEDKKPVANRQAYLIKSINNFFANNTTESSTVISNMSVSKAERKYSDVSYSDRWIAIVQRLCQYRSDEQMRETFDNVSFDSFNPHTGALMLCVIGEGVCERIENSQQDIDLLSRLLREYFDFKSFKWRSFKTREEFLKYKQGEANH